jgi:hypothetical protein
VKSESNQETELSVFLTWLVLLPSLHDLILSVVQAERSTRISRMFRWPSSCQFSHLSQRNLQVRMHMNGGASVFYLQTVRSVSLLAQVWRLETGRTNCPLDLESSGSCPAIVLQPWLSYSNFVCGRNLGGYQVEKSMQRKLHRTFKKMKRWKEHNKRQWQPSKKLLATQ